LKHQLKALAGQNAANGAGILAPVQFIRPAVVKVAPHFAMTPYKRKPCSGCPALKGKLCKCALKVEARKLRQQKAG
ncbi:MAG: hypothetical protein LPD71_14595, partial [Shewanella sp.]|nr:hypothetical protein [Shewanella sp.]